MEEQTHENPWFSSIEGSHTPTEECPYTCPVCMGLSLVKQMRPEVAAHLAAAGREFFLAAKAFLDSMAEAPVDESGRSAVERIDLGD